MKKHSNNIIWSELSVIFNFCFPQYNMMSSGVLSPGVASSEMMSASYDVSDFFFRFCIIQRYCKIIRVMINLIGYFICVPWYGYVWNVHRKSIKIEHRNLEIRKTCNDFFVQVRNFLLHSSLKVFRHKEREAQSFYAGFFIFPPPQTCGTRHNDLREQAKTNRLPSRQVSSQLTDFFKISQNPMHASGAWRHSHSLASVSHLGLFWHLLVIRPLCPRAWTPALMLRLSNPCTEPKGSQPN